MRASWLAALCLLASAPLSARPYSVDDMLGLETLGQVVVDPVGRFVLVETRGPWAAAPRFDYGTFSWRATSRLRKIDIATGQSSDLVPREAGAGYWSGGFSPSGRRLAIFRLKNNQLSLGILDIATGALDWLPGDPDLPLPDPNPVWLAEDRLVYLTRARGDLPRTLASGWEAGRLAGQLGAARAGAVATATLFGSGVYRQTGIAEDANALIAVDTADGGTRVLARGAIQDFSVSPDLRHIAILARGSAVQPDPDRPVAPSFQARRHRLLVHDLARNRTRMIGPARDVLPNLLRWSADGSRLLFYARSDDAEWDEGRLLAYRPASQRLEDVTGGVRPAAETAGGSNLALDASFIGEGIVLRARAGDEAARWYRVGDRGAVPLTDAPGARLLAVTTAGRYVLDDGRLIQTTSDGEAAAVTLPGPVRRVGLEYPDERSAGTRHLFNSELDALPPLIVGDETPTLVRLDEASGRTLWTHPLPSSTSQVLAATRSGIVVTYERDPHGVGRLLVGQAGAAARVVLTLNRHLAAADPVERIAIESRAADGRTLTHWLTLPADHVPAPLVVIPYPGATRPPGAPPAPDLSTFNPVVNAALLAGAGFAVLEPSLPLAASEHAESTITNRAGGTTVVRPRIERAGDGPDMIDRALAILDDAIDAAVETGRVRGDAAMLYGQSYGAYAAVAMATRTNRFRAVIAHAGIYDFASGYGLRVQGNDVAETGLSLTMGFGWFESGQAAFGTSPWADPEAYIRRSPFYALDRIHTPVLLVHGEMDFAPYQSAERLFMGLHRLGRDALLLRYGGEGHFNVSPANIRDQWGRMIAFLRDHSGPGAQSPQ